MKEKSTTEAMQMPWVALGVSQQAYEDFMSFWKTMKDNEQLMSPRVILWLNGAPGAGKGTNASYLQDIFNIMHPPLVTSDLLNGLEFKKIKDSGALVSDGDVTKLVFSCLLSKKYASGIVVDGYPRTKVQAECVKLLHHALQMKQQKSDFQVVVLDVSEKVSIERQLGRGKRAVKNNERVQQTGQGEVQPIRATDTDPKAAKVRYRVFVQQTNDALDVLQHEFPCHRIEAGGSFDEVRSAIYDSFKSL
ncbi:MAG: nucleoside monophosphate kinase [Puniceicoccales bacterium]|nr:nucleoside monophosphate kinase [Puniceicoccales bacterium]